MYKQLSAVWIRASISIDQMGMTTKHYIMWNVHAHVNGITKTKSAAFVCNAYTPAKRQILLRGN